MAKQKCRRFEHGHDADCFFQHHYLVGVWLWPEPFTSNYLQWHYYVVECIAYLFQAQLQEIVATITYALKKVDQ